MSSRVENSKFGPKLDFYLFIIYLFLDNFTLLFSTLHLSPLNPNWPYKKGRPTLANNSYDGRHSRLASLGNVIVVLRSFSIFWIYRILIENVHNYIQRG